MKPKKTAKVPTQQAGDPAPEVAKATAQPVLQSVEQGKKELDEHPGRHSVLTDKGHLVR